jgi:hypothetical protein
MNFQKPTKLTVDAREILHFAGRTAPFRMTPHKSDSHKKAHQVAKREEIFNANAFLLSAS